MPKRLSDDEAKRIHMKCTENDMQAAVRIAKRLRCGSKSAALRSIIRWLDDADDETIDMVRHHIGT